MAVYQYTCKEMNENRARGAGRDLAISTKQCIEVLNSIRRKPVVKAVSFLERVIKGDQAVEMRRFNMDTGHKKSVSGPGRYPIKTATAVLKVLKAVEANALQKGLNPDRLVIVHCNCQRGASQWKAGRRRHKSKNTSIEIIVEEKVAKAKPQAKKAPKAAEPKSRETEKVQKK